MAFSEVTRERARQIIARYPEGRSRSALLPLLHLVQSELALGRLARLVIRLRGRLGRGAQGHHR